MAWQFCPAISRPLNHLLSYLLVFLTSYLPFLLISCTPNLLTT